MQDQTPNMENILKIAVKDDPNYDEVMNQFKVSCPVKKINISEETPGAIAGMFILTSENGVELLKEKADLSDLEDTTILFFTNQHLVEMCNVIYGISVAINGVPKDDSEKAKSMNAIYTFIDGCSTPITYYHYKKLIINVHSDIVYTGYYKYYKIREKIIEILRCIPFVSYNNLDEIAKSALDEVKLMWKDIKIDD